MSEAHCGYSFLTNKLSQYIFTGLANRSQTGVIAQDIQKILPDAVSSSGPYLLNNGELIDDMLIVDKDRLFLGKNQFVLI